MLPPGTMVYRPADPTVIGHVLKESVTFPGYLWISWPDGTYITNRTELKVA